jgi:hypothetical protein
MWLPPRYVDGLKVQTAIGEDNAQRKTHMAASADNDNLSKLLHELLIASFRMSAGDRIVNRDGPALAPHGDSLATWSIEWQWHAWPRLAIMRGAVQRTK